MPDYILSFLIAVAVGHNSVGNAAGEKDWCH